MRLVAKRSSKSRAILHARFESWAFVPPRSRKTAIAPPRTSELALIGSCAMVAQGSS